MLLPAISDVFLIYFFFLNFSNLSGFKGPPFFFIFSSFCFLPSISAVITFCLFSFESNANLANFFGATCPSLSCISLKAGINPALMKHPSLSLIELDFGKDKASLSSRSIQNGESFNHILKECPFDTRTPVRVLQGKNGEPISQRYVFIVLSKETMLYSAVPVISKTDFGDSGVPCNDASCHTSELKLGDKTYSRNSEVNKPIQLTIIYIYYHQSQNDVHERKPFVRL